MATKIDSASPQPRLLDVKSAARYLSTTIWCMRTLAWEKKVPHVKLGHRMLFDIADLDQLIVNMKQVA